MFILTELVVKLARVYYGCQEFIFDLQNPIPTKPHIRYVSSAETYPQAALPSSHNHPHPRSLSLLPMWMDYRTHIQFFLASCQSLLAKSIHHSPFLEDRQQ